ncbi:arginine deiminase [Oenococcus sicerae]|uniref:arginine deiminase n=1 Tax=Oenococcus sicerae TaxID=2203724 RepID=UPI0010B8BB2F|nr:Arginine deiminase {ECO:0000255/HAMAP-Rule:MF_00242} [Oenococcus sicerae]
MTNETLPINVNSEIGPLKQVILHRPGHEVENLMPETMKSLLFDDIPFLPQAQKEHDAFAAILTKNATEVLYLEKLAAEALQTSPQVKRDFLKQLLGESAFKSGDTYDQLTDYLLDMPAQAMVNQIMAGIRRGKIQTSANSLSRFVNDQTRPFLIDPMPNLYFTRDPAAAIGHGLTISSMTFQARRRESLFMQLIVKHHPRFADQPIHIWRDRDQGTRLEGGDELILSSHVLAIGISERTSSEAIQDLAKSLFSASAYDTIIAIQIPHVHAMMHLDTVFTMVNRDQFTVYPGIFNEQRKMPIFVLHQDRGNSIKVEHFDDLAAVLKRELGLSELDLILTADGDPVAAAREQWNDGSNTLAIAPGVVVTYDRNYVSNQVLRKHGVKVWEIPSSELSRGRGGPRCMSMPIYREDLKA